MKMECWEWDPVLGSCFPPSWGLGTPLHPSVPMTGTSLTHPVGLAGTATPSPPRVRRGAPPATPTLLTWVLVPCSPVDPMLPPQPARHPLCARPRAAHAASARQGEPCSATPPAHPAPRPHPKAPVTHPDPRKGRTLERGLPPLPDASGWGCVHPCGLGRATCNGLSQTRLLFYRGGKAKLQITHYRRPTREPGRAFNRSLRQGRAVPKLLRGARG